MIGSDAVEAIGFFTATASIAWSAAYAWVKWLPYRQREAERASASALPVGDSHRLAALESTIEALALEIERLGEAQRYTARLLEERLPPLGAPGPAPRLSDGGRVTTPH
jgi:hypothetical protein